MSFVLKNIVKKYEEQIVLKNISFDIANKGIIGLLGPNGAGKSTTMKIMCGIINADSGDVLFNNETINFNNLSFKNKIGYLPESNPLYLDFYVKEYLEFVASVYEVKNKSEKIKSVIASVGLSKEQNKKIEQLSKGYKQRVGIASVLLHEPEILILDEPTSGLDPNQVVEIRNLIKQLGKQKTVFFSTHILQEVEAICNQVIILHQGNIIVNDSLQNIHKKYSTSFVYASFKKNLVLDDFEFIKNYCSKISQTENGKWKFVSQHNDLIKKELIKQASVNNWELDSIYQEQQSLETIFNNLTKENIVKGEQ